VALCGTLAQSSTLAAARAIKVDATMLKEFKEFALRGNLVDLAIGFIIGVAFSGLVQSLVNDIIMPIIGWITGGVDFSNLYIQLAGTPAATLEEARKAGATLAYGSFITLVLNFILIAFVLFIFVKAMNRMKTPAAPTPAAAAPRQEVLLEEIRSLLAKNLMARG
jgi:large conductance mechanosensitive channel